MKKSAFPFLNIVPLGADMALDRCLSIHGRSETPELVWPPCRRRRRLLAYSYHPHRSDKCVRIIRILLRCTQCTLVGEFRKFVLQWNSYQPNSYHRDSTVLDLLHSSICCMDISGGILKYAIYYEICMQHTANISIHTIDRSLMCFVSNFSQIEIHQATWERPFEKYSCQSMKSQITVACYFSFFICEHGWEMNKCYCFK